MFRFRPPVTPEVSQTDHLRSPPFKSRNPLSRPALRGGVIWPGSACDPRPLSCTFFDPSVLVGAGSIRPRAASLAPAEQFTFSFASPHLLSVPPPLRWVMGQFCRTAATRSRMTSGGARMPPRLCLRHTAPYMAKQGGNRLRLHAERKKCSFFVFAYQKLTSRRS